MMDSIKIIEKKIYDDILIVFSARKCEPNKFTFYNQVIGFPANIIFVNDYSTNWYLNGTPEFKNSLDFIKYMIQHINKIKKRNSKIYILGSSMGAYGALLYGAIFQADKILAMAPESELCIPLGRSIESLNNNYKEGDESICELQYKADANITVISGNNDIVDLYCTSKLKYYNSQINIKIINNYTHVVAKYINEKIGMKDFLLEYFFYNKIEKFFNLMDLTYIIDFYDMEHIKEFNESLIIQKKVDISKKEFIYNVASRYKKWSMIQYFSACIAYEEKDIELSIHFLKKALESQSSLGRARLKLAKIYYEGKQFEYALEELKILKKQNFTYTIGLLLLKVYLILDNMEAAYICKNNILNTLSLNRTQKEKIEILFKEI